MAARMFLNVVVCLALLAQAFPVSLAPGSPSACSPITIGQTIAGAIAVAGEEDCYTFSATAGQAVYFDSIASSASHIYMYWRLVGPASLVVFDSSSFNDQHETLAAGGVYTLSIGGDDDITGAYQFKLWNVPPPDGFAIQIGDTVSNGVPGAGAGNIETPGVEDRYTFSAAAGQTVYFDVVTCSVAYNQISWRLEDPSSQAVFDLNTFNDQHKTLSAGGLYTLIVDGNGDITSTYQLKLWNVPPPDGFAIQIGDTVSNGVPGPGAGNIETPGVEDRYTFSAAAGQTVQFDAISSSAAYNLISWRLIDPVGLAVFDNGYFNDQQKTLSAGGVYTLTVDGDGDTTSAYQFRLLDAAGPDWSRLTFGVGHTDTLTHSFEIDGYSVVAAAGQHLSIQVAKDTAWYGSLYIRYGAHPSAGAYDVRSYRVSGDQEVSIPVTQAGSYYILLESGDFHPDYGAYTITARLLTAENLSFNVPQDITISPGTPCIYQIDVPNSTPNLFLRLQKTDDWRSEFRLFKGYDELVSSPGYADPIIQLPAPAAGTYYLSISGVGQGRLTVSSALPALALGQWKTGAILRPSGSAWYQLQVPAGQASLYTWAETAGLFGQLDLYRSTLNDPPVQSAHGASLQLALSAPPAGRYYLHLTDSATVIGADQERDHMIKADAQPIDPPPCSAPVINNFSPTQGGTSMPVTVSIDGQCQSSEAAVCLKRTGSSNVCAASVAGDATRRTLNALFDLSTATPGSWTLQVTNPGQAPALAAAPFVVQSQGEAQLWIEITGREQIRIGRFQTYHIQYGNSGPVDAYDVLLNVSFPAGWEVEWEMPHPDLAAVDWDTISGVVETGAEKIIPFWLLKVGAGSQAGFDIAIKIPEGTPGERVQLSAEIIQVDSAYAYSGDRADIDSSPVFSSLVESIRQAFATVPAGSVGAASGRLKTPVDEPPIEEIKDVLRDMLIGEFFPDDAIIGGAVGAIIALAVGGPLAIYMASGMVIGELIGFAIDQYELEKAKADALETFMDELDAMQISSVSPEDKYGPSGYDPAGAALAQLKRWIPASRAIAYRIDFWNKEDAPAATQDVIITDQLDADLDWSSFRFTEVGFLDWRATIEPAQYFNLDIAGVSIDLSPYYPGEPVIDLVVNVEGTFDPSSGAIEWQFHALDPLTRDYPENPYAGFLPPYTASGWEIGWANFSVSPKAGAASGTAIQNQSFVKFDLNEFKPAPKAGPFLNTLDAAAPLAAVKSPSGAQACSAFLVTWTAKDEANGSGVGGVDVYADDLGDAAPPYLWLAGAGGLSAVFRGLPGHSYGFYALARDHAGNLQAAPSPLKYDVQASAGSYCIWMPLARTRPR